MTNRPKGPYAGRSQWSKHVVVRTSRVCVLCLVILLCTSLAMAENQEACKAVLADRAPLLVAGTAFDPALACNALAGFIIDALTESSSRLILTPDSISVAAIFSQRDLQNQTSHRTNTSGTAAQGHAIPSVQPAGVAAGTIAAIGTRTRQETLAALSVNPAVLFLTNHATERLARLARLADVTVLLPVSAGTAEDAAVTGHPSDRLRYFGTRLRLNLTGLSAGTTVWEQAEAILRTRIAAAALALGTLERLLEAEGTDVAVCATALLENDESLGAVESACGVAFGFEPSSDTAMELRRQLAGIRRSADAQYFGLDLRLDVGDPTLGEVDNARGRSLFAGLSGGRRFGRTAGIGIRGRLGIRHAILESESRSEFAAEGGVGVEVSRSFDDGREVNIAGAVEFRHGNAPANLTERFQTDFVMLRGSISLPVTNGNSVSINVGTPLVGNVSPLFSVNFNWGLLLPEQAAGF